jgi:carboxylesterase
MNNYNQKIMPGAGPFYYKGNHIGILLIHGGGGGTCADLKPLAQDLHDKSGFTVSVPLLPGFGTSPEDLKASSIGIWKDVLKKEYNSLKQDCEFVIVGGHSMGGVLAIILAHQFEVNGISTISTPIGIRGIGIKLVPIMKLFMHYHKIPSEKFKEDTNGKWVGYDKIPLNVVDKYRLLIKEMKQILPEINAPIILLQGRKDTQIKKESMNEIYKRVRSTKKKKVWLDNNEHPILDCPDHKQLTKELNEFILEIVH